MDRRYPIKPFDSSKFEPSFGEKIADTEVKLLSGGACNRNYLVTTKNREKYFCRIHNRGTPLTEHYITQLAKEFVPAVEYLWIGDGVSIMGFIDGVHFKPTPGLMRNAGWLISSMSKVKFDRSGEIKTDGKVEPFDGWDSCHSGFLSLLRNEKVSAMLTELAVYKKLK
ncbi:phosphotransferase [Puniceicoccaceae bacterium K14]|nr:phosphotransferase [Puniceicoccaceae bacterium K14]